MPRSWYSSQTIVFAEVIVSAGLRSEAIKTIEPGNYNVYSFLDQLQIKLPSWTITYIKDTNKYSFSAPAGSNGYGLKIYTYSNMFGFHMIENNSMDGVYLPGEPTLTSGTLPDDINPDVFFETPIVSGGSILLSKYPIQMIQENSMFIHADLPRRRMAAIDNLNSKTFQESDIIFKIPISTFGPYDNIYTRNSDVSFFLSTLDVNKIRFYVTDQNNVKINLLEDWTITLRFEFVKEEDHQEKEILKELRDLLKYFVMTNTKLVKD
jgi:hypothetical protein